MGIFDDIVVNAKSAAESVGKHAEKIVDTSKLRVNLAEINSEIEENFEELGKFVYENCKEALADEVEATGKIVAIDELKAQADAVNKALLEMQNKKICPECGAERHTGDLFCSSCGAKLDEEV